MGLIGTLLKLTRTSAKVKGNAPGKSAVAHGDGVAGQAIDPEVYQAPGVFGLPGDGVRGVLIPIGGSSRYGIVIAVHNYHVEIDVGGQGGVALYSTTPDGRTVKAKVVVKPDGSIELNGDSKKLVTHGELDSALQAFKGSIDAAIAGAITGHTHIGNLGYPTAPGTGAAPPTSLDISGSATTTVKTGG